MKLLLAKQLYPQRGSIAFKTNKALTRKAGHFVPPLDEDSPEFNALSARGQEVVRVFFEIPSVSFLLISPDELTVDKNIDADWHDFEKAVEAIMRRVVGWPADEPLSDVLEFGGRLSLDDLLKLDSDEE
jgi:hypothetical protein